MFFGIAQGGAKEPSSGTTSTHSQPNTVRQVAPAKGGGDKKKAKRKR